MQGKRETAIALGTFDGLHLGHKAVLQNALSSAENAVCLSFVMPPAAYGDNFDGMLMQPEVKRDMLLSLGFGDVRLLEFSQVRDISAQCFFDRVVEKYQPSVICCGFNYTFGANRSGDIHLLAQLCEKRGIRLSVCEPVSELGDTVSSGRIRKLLKEGNIASVNALLGHEWSFKSVVRHGDKRGRTIGFPTINQQLPKGFAVPKFGVYASFVEIDGKKYRSVTNIGIRPTFLLDAPLCETFISGIDGDLYGRTLTLGLNRFIRPEQRFASLSDLQRQISADKTKALGGK